MANEKDIKIGLQTVGADAAAREIEKVPDAIQQIPASTPDAANAIDDVTESIFRMRNEAEEAQAALDEIEAKRRQVARESTGGLLGADLSKGIEEAGQQVADNTGFGQEYRAFSAMIGADAVAIAGSVAAIGAATVAGYKMLSGTVDGYKKLMEDAAAQGRTLGPEIEDQIKALEATLSPFGDIFDVIGEKVHSMWEAIKSPIDTFSGLGDLREALEREAQAMAMLQQTRLQIANNRQADVTATYDRELAALREQEATMKRIAALRNELASLEVQGSRQEVEAAKLRGGDVELAKANALAAELKADLASLGDNLRAAQQSAVEAEQQFEAASDLYQSAIRDGLDKLDPAKFQELSSAYDTTQKALADANQAVADQTQIFASGKTNLLRGAENELAKLDTETQGEISKAAEQARQGIYNTIREEFSTIGDAAGQVKTVVAEDRKATVQAIQQLAPQPQEKAAVVQAVQSVDRSIQDQGTAIIAALASVQAGIAQITNRISAQQAQINQLFARSR